MENKPTLDLSIIAPLLLGAFSLCGIAAVFVFGRVQAARSLAAITPTDTPFKYVYLGTEPSLSTLTPESTLTPILLPTSDEPQFILFTPTPGDTSTTGPTPPPGVTATITPTIQAVLSKVDDTYFEILYSGNWVAQSDVSGTHQNTLHISFNVGNSASYTFTGEQLIFAWQAGPSLGTATINLDGLIIDFDQSDSETSVQEWVSPVLVWGTHTIIITHASGGSINLDSFTIPDLSTATPEP
jgi:hypothetical protein